MKSFSGCWTCRLRRKKCDETHPVCDACATLQINCYYSQDKPDWMDGGARQEEMVQQLKRQVKENSYYRRADRTVQTFGGRVSIPEATNGEETSNLTSSASNIFEAASDLINDETSTVAAPRLQYDADGTLIGKGTREGLGIGRCDTALFMFYLEHMIPFLFPFYRPSILEGGKAWILEMLIKSPVIRQTALCQGSYFFALVQGATKCDILWETILSKTRNAFSILGQALQVIYKSNVTEHFHGAVRVLASIMQMQRFEIAVLSFNNCQAHLNAALTLFEQLMDSMGNKSPADNFNGILDRLGPSSAVLPRSCIRILNAEQAAFHFSSTLLIFDDIIASTVLQERPRLYRYHRSLLHSVENAKPSIDLEAVIGCQNWVLIHIGEIVMLDAWKQQCKKTGELDVMELVHRAAVIKDSLKAHLTQLDTDTGNTLGQSNSLLDILTEHSRSIVCSSSLVTRIWAHAALLYLCVVVSGWQAANVDVRYHVGQIIDLLMHQISPPAILRTMVWPFCVAGCLAEPTQEAQFRQVAEALQPPSIFGTVRRALGIMEAVWDNRKSTDVEDRDLSTCLRSQGDLILFV